MNAAIHPKKAAVGQDVTMRTLDNISAAAVNVNDLKAHTIQRGPARDLRLFKEKVHRIWGPYNWSVSGTETFGFRQITGVHQDTDSTANPRDPPSIRRPCSPFHARAERRNRASRDINYICLVPRHMQLPLAIRRDSPSAVWAGAQSQHPEDSSASIDFEVSAFQLARCPYCRGHEDPAGR